MTRLLQSILPRWPLWALLAAMGMLGVAHGFEIFKHLSPCELCLKQRDAYWAAIGIAAVGVILGFTPVKARGLICLLLAGAFLWGGGEAVYQAGAEWKFWPGPAACSGGAMSVSLAEISKLLHGGAHQVVRCDQAAWVFLGLSMAGWNALVSAGLVGLSVAAVRSPAR